MKLRPLCIYCQERRADTVEHVVARAFFGKRQPHVPIKAPSCIQCNRGLSRDEEYVRTIFAQEINSAEHPVAKQLLSGEIARSFDYSPGFLKLITDGMSIGEAHTKEGIVIPNMVLMTVDGNRITRVMTKIARGIFYTYTRRHLPKTTPVFVSNKLVDAQQAKLINGVMEKWTPNTGWVWVGADKAFQFRMAIPSITSDHAIWLLVFYGSIVICAHSLHMPTTKT